MHSCRDAWQSSCFPREELRRPALKDLRNHGHSPVWLRKWNAQFHYYKLVRYAIYYSLSSPLLSLCYYCCSSSSCLILAPILPCTIHRGDDLLCIQSERPRDYVLKLAFKAKVPFETLFPDADSQALDLLEHLLTFDPAKRYTAEQVRAWLALENGNTRSMERTCWWRWIKNKYIRERVMYIAVYSFWFDFSLVLSLARPWPIHTLLNTTTQKMR